MPKHTPEEIQAAYDKGAEHSLGAASQAAYDMGYGAGIEDTKLKILAGDPELRKDIDERKAAEKPAHDAAELKAKEDEHNRTAARKRQLHDSDADEEETRTASATGNNKKPATSATRAPHR